MPGIATRGGALEISRTDVDARVGAPEHRARALARVIREGYLGARHRLAAALAVHRARWLAVGDDSHERSAHLRGCARAGGSFARRGREAALRARGPHTLEGARVDRLRGRLEPRGRLPAQIADRRRREGNAHELVDAERAVVRAAHAPRRRRDRDLVRARGREREERDARAPHAGVTDLYLRRF